jgi:type IV pilus assembly protein PilO
MASFLPKTQREQLMVLVGILGVAAAGLYWNFKYVPRSAELDGLQTRVDSLEAHNQRAKAELASGSVADLQREAEALEGDLVLMRQLVPEGNEVPLLLEQVSDAARRVGLDIGSVQPLGVDQGADFDAHRYQLSLQGSYHTVAEFLTNVGSLTRIVAPMNVTLTSASSAAARPGGVVPTVTATFELHTYVVRNAPGGAQ